MTMAVGPDGNNAPAYTTDGIPYQLWLEVKTRIYTYYGREFNNPDYGLGLVDALRFPEPGIETWRRRLRRSFEQLEAQGYEYVMGDVRRAGNSLIFDVTIDGTEMTVRL